MYCRKYYFFQKETGNFREEKLFAINNLFWTKYFLKLFSTLHQSNGNKKEGNDKTHKRKRTSLEFKEGLFDSWKLQKFPIFSSLYCKPMMCMGSKKLKHGELIKYIFLFIINKNPIIFQLNWEIMFVLKYI